MAKAKEAKSVVNMSLLAAINSGAVTRVTQDEGIPLINHNPPLIDANPNDVVDGKAAVRLTDAGKALLPNGHDAKQELVNSDVPRYAIIPGFTFEVGPAKTRGRLAGGAPVIYPWATMDVGASFFVGVSEKTDPVKSMTSAVSSTNMKYSEPTGEKRTRTMAKRGPGNKAVLNPDGTKVMETKEVDVMKPTRKFQLREVKKGDTFGNWTAPEDGVLVGRVL